MDHEITFNSTLVATRPNSTEIKQVFSYELPGFVKEPFLANYFEDITDIKIPAKIYIDDRGYKFESWKKTIE